MTSRRELKNYAKQAMSGKYGILILAFVAVQALALISSMISSALFPGEETIDIVLSYAFTFILTLLINVVAAGMNYMYLNIARGKVYSLNDLFYFYRHHPDRVIVAGFFIAVLNLLTMLPYTIYSNANLPGEDASVEVLITWLYTGVVLMIVGMIVYQILVIPLEMTYYILADKPELKSTEAMKESLEMMHGNFGRYLMLKISFIPLMFLSVFTDFGHSGQAATFCKKSAWLNVSSSIIFSLPTVSVSGTEANLSSCFHCSRSSPQLSITIL